MPRLVIVMLVVVAVLEGSYIGVKYLRTPWARTHDGHPPLVGYWQGEMQLETGDTRRVVLYLREFETISDFLLRSSMADWDGTPDPDLRVAAKLCGSKGRALYHGNGDLANREATRFTFGLTTESPALGKHPSNLEAVWDGRDRLELTSRVYVEGPHGAVAEASATARPSSSARGGGIRFEMHRSTEEVFTAAC